MARLRELTPPMRRMLAQVPEDWADIPAEIVGSVAKWQTVRALLDREKIQIVTAGRGKSVAKWRKMPKRGSAPDGASRLCHGTYHRRRLAASTALLHPKQALLPVLNHISFVNTRNLDRVWEG